MKAPKQGMSLRAYARRNAVSEAAIRTAIKSGLLRSAIYEDGSIDVARADEVLARSVTRGKNAADALQDARVRKLRAETVLAIDEARLAAAASVPASIAATTWMDMSQRFVAQLAPILKAGEAAAGLPVPEAFRLLESEVHACLHRIAEDVVVPADEPPAEQRDLSAAGPADLTTAKLEAQAERLELERAVTVGERVPVRDVEAAWTGRAAVLRAGLLGLAHRAAILMPDAGSAEAGRKAVRDVIAEALQALEANSLAHLQLIGWLDDLETTGPDSGQGPTPLVLVNARGKGQRSLRPPPKLTISQWADGFRRLSSESSAEPGQWMTHRAEYQRGIMDAISEHPYVVVMTSSQVGKTEILNNVAGYHVCQDPAPILVLQPTLEMAETWSKDRLAPMVRDTPALTSLIADPRARDSGNTLLHKKFPGGHITVVGANSPSSLASRPIRVVLADEVDRYPASAGTEGDPLSLAIKRTTTFWTRRVVVVSTPTIKGISRVEAEWERSDQRRYHVPCPHCQTYQWLKWGQVRWPEGRPEEALYHCEECGAAWTDAERRAAIRWGKWIAGVPDARIVGFHLSELYSPWSSPSDMAVAFLAAKRSAETLKAWVNTSLGETWEDAGEQVDEGSLMSRAEHWGPLAPDRVLVVTCGVDIQEDRIEVERVGWGVGEESWSLEHRIIYGDTASQQPWAELDGYLLTPTKTGDGRSVTVGATAIDSGYRTQAVYEFVKTRTGRRVHAVKGVSGAGRPVWPKRATKAKGKVNVFIVGVDAAKDSVYARLRLSEPGAGFCHFPRDRERQWFEQLTAEKVVTRYQKGFPVRVWQKQSTSRNEALDCRVYAYAALLSLNVVWQREIRRAATAERQAVEMTVDEVEVTQEVVAAAPATQPVPQRPLFVRRATRSRFA
ncbi:terminase gpA endonuclease subunit [Alsobacter sp. R-9]